MALADDNLLFFAVAVQQHRCFGIVFTPYIVKMISREGGIHTIVDSLTPQNQGKWEYLLPEGSRELVKNLNDISDSTIHKQFAKGKVNLADFIKSVPADGNLFQFIRSYIERRILKCFDILCQSPIPVYLKEKNFNNLYEDHRLTLVAETALPVFNFSVKDNESLYHISASCNGTNVNLTSRDSEIITFDPCLVRINREVYRFQDIDGKKVSPFLTKPHISIPKSAERKYFETFVLNAVRNQLIVAEGFTIEQKKLHPKAILSLEERLAGGTALVLKFSYGGKFYLGNSKHEPEANLCIIDNRYHFERFERNKEWEKGITLALNNIGLFSSNESEFLPTTPNGGMYDSNYYLFEWINVHHHEIEAMGIDLVQNFYQQKYYLKTVTLEFNTTSAEDWFDLYGKVKLDTFEIPFIYLRKHILKGIKEYVLPNGQIFILPTEWFARYKPLLLLGKESGDKLIIRKALFNLLLGSQIDSPIANRLRERFGSNTPDKLVFPRNFKANLRDYQKQGYIWLNILRQNGLGGCLADDMGLGKTIQTLALLQLLKELRNGDETTSNGLPVMSRTSLIVVPTSLIHNWYREAQRFAPDLNIHIFTGTQRTRSIAGLMGHDVVLTTYGIVRNDIDMLKEVHFNYVILDESQAIKNPVSQIYRAVLLLKASHYLTISGTPIENSLSDLWAQLNFLNRGMLGSLKVFRDEFILPVEKQRDPEKEKLLKQLIEPFILRRTKEQVALDLPPVNEQVIYCDMTESQQKCYEMEKSQVRNSILENIEAVGYSRSSISILRGLTRLRQISNHPALVDDYSGLDSGKFDEITRSIESVVAEGHKILLFSSFVKHLSIVERYLTDRGIGYALLTGGTTNRREVVDRFQTDPDIKVFLISIKAGGVGLNLTAADYIFILDPWWNPAVENQAISRAHRIGQDKNIFVYRFITLDTVEEKIIKLQERKELLAETFVDSNNPLKAIDQGMLLEIIG